MSANGGTASRMSAEPTFCQCDFLHLISEIITESNLEIYSRVETRLRLFLPIFKQNLPATLLMTASSMQWRLEGSDRGHLCRALGSVARSATGFMSMTSINDARRVIKAYKLL